MLSFVGITGAWKVRVVGDDALQSDVYRQVGYVLLALLAFLPALLNPRHALRGFTWPLLLLFGWCGFSLLWSPVPGIALKRFALTLLVSFCCLTIVRHVHPKDALRAIWLAVMALVVASMVTVAVAPEIGIHQQGDHEASVVGSWRGIFYHKNILGPVAAFGLLLSMHEFVAAQNAKRGVYGVALSACIVLLAFSLSKTSIAMALASALLFMVLRANRTRTKRVMLWLTFGSVFGVGIALFALPIAGVDVDSTFSDPQSFTGRGMIWSLLWDSVNESPLMGVGYQSVFQVGGESVLAGVTGDSFYDTLAHAHNAYLELLVSIGAVGLLVALGAIVMAPVRAAIAADGPFAELRPVLLSVMAFVFMHAMLESGLVDRDRPTWLMLLLMFGVALSVRDQKRKCHR